MLKWGKRRILFKTATLAGGLCALEMHNRGKLRILNYHRMLPHDRVLDQVAFDQEVYDTDEQSFVWQLDYLAGRFRFIGLDELKWRLSRGGEVRDNPVLLSFDDGYSDIYHQVFPLLRARNIPAAFFVPTRRLSDRNLETWEQVAYCIHHSPLGEFHVNFQGWKASGDLRAGKREAARDLCKMAVKMFGGAEREFLHYLAGQLQSHLPSCEEMDNQIVTENQMREMQVGGMAFGSHSHRHAVLAKLSGKELADELSLSREILEAILREKVDVVSYPHGKRGEHYNVETMDAAKHAGFCLGLNYMNGLVDLKKVNPFDVNRIPVNRPDELGFKASLQGFLI
jgi:peptidoglycan/xylan/chitin deacetylase (PgdA/CDA1 family)